MLARESQPSSLDIPATSWLSVHGNDFSGMRWFSLTGRLSSYAGVADADVTTSHLTEQDLERIAQETVSGAESCGE